MFHRFHGKWFPSEEREIVVVSKMETGFTLIAYTAADASYLFNSLSVHSSCLVVSGDPSKGCV